MQQSFEGYTEAIIQQIDGSNDDKADIKEELLSHLQQSKETFMEDGNSEEQAIVLALQYFGPAKSVGKGMQEAMFPHRRFFFLLLSFTSLFTIFSTYLAALFIDGDAYIIWLCTIVLSSIMLLLFTGHFFPRFERKSLLICLLIIHVLLFIYGYLIASQFDHGLSIPLSIMIVIIITFSIFLIYRIVLNDYPYRGSTMKNIHLINMTLGIIVIGSCLFILWAMLSFFVETSFVHFIPLAPILFWIVSYMVQIQLWKYGKKRATFLLLGSTYLVFIVGLVVFF